MYIKVNIKVIFFVTISLLRNKTKKNQKEHPLFKSIQKRLAKAKPTKYHSEGRVRCCHSPSSGTRLWHPASLYLLHPCSRPVLHNVPFTAYHRQTCEGLFHPCSLSDVCDCLKKDNYEIIFLIER